MKIFPYFLCKTVLQDYIMPKTRKLKKVDKEKKVVVPKATVMLKNCTSYKKEGMMYKKEVVFTVSGEELIKYYEKDGHFLVTRM